MTGTRLETRVGTFVGAMAAAAVLLGVASIPTEVMAQTQSVKQTEQSQTVKRAKRVQASQPVKQKTAAKPAPRKEAAMPAEPAKVSKPDEAAKKPHNLVLQVNVNDPGTMNLALNNASNVAQYYKARGEPVTIEVVAFGPGLHMLRDDTSPVKARIKALSESTPSISFEACGNTRDNMTKAEGMDVPLIPEAKVTESGVVLIMQRQEQGWTYVRP